MQHVPTDHTDNPDKPAVGVIGYGRFGKLIAQLLASDFAVKVYDIDSSMPLIGNPITPVDLDALLLLKTIFIAVPIRAFADMIQKIAPKITANTTLIDVCSVKVYPVKIMQQYLPVSVGIIATHPLFGPDSFSQANQDLKIVIYSVRDIYDQFAVWKKFFSKKNITVLTMTPDEHDRLAAQSQGLTHFIGRCLETIDSHATPIDTVGYQKLLAVMQQTCNDSFELFIDLIRFNPYAKNSITQFILAAEELQKLLINYSMRTDRW